MILSLSRDVIVTETEIGMVLLDERAGRYWQLNPTGADALRLLLAGKSTEDAAVALSRPPASTSEQVAADVTALVGALSKAGLVVVTP